MALQLTKVATRLFSGASGAVVNVGISVAMVSAGTPADIVSVTYNGQTTSAPPFRITLASGDHGLVVVYVTTPGTKVSLDEIDAAKPANTQSLAKTFFDATDPSVIILIQVP